MNIKEYIREMYTHYFRADAFHTVKNPLDDATSGNMHLINATHYTIINKFNMIMADDQTTALRFIDACMERPGIYNRAPTKFDQQAHDDYIGLCCTSKQLYLPIALDIYNYGSKHWWYFDNTQETPKFEFRNWYGRFPWAIFTFKVCAKEKASLFLQASFGVYLYLQRYNKNLTDTSGRILAWLQKEAVKGKYPLVDWFIGKWEDDLKAKYPNGMGDVMGIYHGTDHPFTLILQGEV